MIDWFQFPRPPFLPASFSLFPLWSGEQTSNLENGVSWEAPLSDCIGHASSQLGHGPAAWKMKVKWQMASLMTFKFRDALKWQIADRSSCSSDQAFCSVIGITNDASITSAIWRVTAKLNLTVNVNTIRCDNVYVRQMLEYCCRLLNRRWELSQHRPRWL